MTAPLLPFGDRTCSECDGKGTVPETVTDYSTGEEFDAAVDCDYCEKGQITERQNSPSFDLTFDNRLTRELILNERFRSAAKRRSCWRRGQMSCRFVLADSYIPEIGKFVAVGLYPTLIPSGPVIALPCYAGDYQTTLALLQLGLTHPDNLHPDAKTILLFQ